MDDMINTYLNISGEEIGDRDGCLLCPYYHPRTTRRCASVPQCEHANKQVGHASTRHTCPEA
jgi:hypothetical protein